MDIKTNTVSGTVFKIFSKPSFLDDISCEFVYLGCFHP